MKSKDITLRLTSYNLELAMLALIRKYIKDHPGHIKWYVSAYELGISPTTMYQLRKKLEMPEWKEKLDKIPI